MNVVHFNAAARACAGELGAWENALQLLRGMAEALVREFFKVWRFVGDGCLGEPLLSLGASRVFSLVLRRLFLANNCRLLVCVALFVVGSYDACG